jgi:ABC-type sugar transport system ATPase subunit
LTSAIETSGLTKSYRRRVALSDCTIKIPTGRVVGLVGPNGAGKTTLLHLAVGLLEPSGGTISVLGRRPADGPEQLRRVGFVSQDAPVYSGFTVGDHLEVGRWTNPLSEDVLRVHPALHSYGGKSVIVGIRPEDLHPAGGGRMGSELKGHVELVEALGSELLVHFSTDAKILQSERTKGVTESGEEEADASQTCVAKIEPGHAVHVGDEYVFLIDGGRLEFFDELTEQAIWT